MLYHLWFLKLHIVDVGDDDAVACGTYFVKRGFDLVILLFDVGKLEEELHQRFVVVDGKTRKLPDKPIEKSVCKCHLDGGFAATEIDLFHANVFDICIFRRLGKAFCDIACFGDLCGAGGNGLMHTAMDGVRAVERIHEVGKSDGDLRYGKFEQYELENVANIVFVKVETVYERNRGVIAFFERECKHCRFFAFGARGIEHDDEGFAHFMELGCNARFTVDIVFSGKLTEGAVAGNENADGGMIADDLLRADLRRFVKGHTFL